MSFFNVKKTFCVSWYEKIKSTMPAWPSLGCYCTRGHNISCLYYCVGIVSRLGSLWLTLLNRPVWFWNKMRSPEGTLTGLYKESVIIIIIILIMTILFIGTFISIFPNQFKAPQGWIFEACCQWALYLMRKSLLPYYLYLLCRSKFIILFYYIWMRNLNKQLSSPSFSSLCEQLPALGGACAPCQQDEFGERGEPCAPEGGPVRRPLVLLLLHHHRCARHHGMWPRGGPCILVSVTSVCDPGGGPCSLVSLYPSPRYVTLGWPL